MHFCVFVVVAFSICVEEEVEEEEEEVFETRDLPVVCGNDIKRISESLYFVCWYFHIYVHVYTISVFLYFLLVFSYLCLGVHIFPYFYNLYIVCWHFHICVYKHKCSGRGCVVLVVVFWKPAMTILN